MNLERIAQRVDRALAVVDQDGNGASGGTPGRGSLLVLVGLPGSGKSLVARTMQQMVPSIVVSTDATRGILGCEPTGSDEERRFVYEVCYRVVRRRLNDRQRVIFDGSNHTAAHRERLASLAQDCGAAAAFCHVRASEDVVFERLQFRGVSKRPEDLQSGARWDVYCLMAGLEEPIARPHLRLDSSVASAEELAAEALEYWKDAERVG